MSAQAVVFNNPRSLSLQTLDLPELQAGQLEVAVEYSGISTGTERMLWDGSMPAFPGLGYPLVPGDCLLYTSPSPRDLSTSRMPSSA